MKKCCLLLQLVLLPLVANAYKIAESWRNFATIEEKTTSSNIVFEDAEVKRICVANWDTNRDGELSYTEAAAVTDLNNKFCSNTVIKSFKELEYFTGLTILGTNDMYEFTGCSNLTSISIPSSVTLIEEDAFGDCVNLNAVYISDLEAWCNITFKEGWADYVTSNPLHYASHLFLNGVEIKDLIIPNSVTSINYGAFDGCSLTSVTIHDGVTSIGDVAFANCSSLTSVAIGNVVTSIGNYAFYGCKGLTTITIPNSVTSIGYKAFNNCSDLTTIVSEIEKPFAISDNVFASNYSTTTLIVPYGTRSLYQSTAGWKNFTNIVEMRTIHVATPGTLSNLITEYDKWNIEELKLTGNINGTDLGILREMAGRSSYGYCGYSDYEYNHFEFPRTSGKLTVLDISEVSIVSGGTYLQRAGNGGHTYVASNSVIPQRVFSRCILTSIKLPSNITWIGEEAFEGCSALASIRIPNSVTSMGNNAFSNCSGLTSVTIGNGLTSIRENNFFTGCSNLTSIVVESGNTKYDSRDNCNALIETSSNTLIIGCKNTIIPNSVTSIGDDAFYGCSGLTSVTIPNSVTSIGWCAFNGCI